MSHSLMTMLVIQEKKKTLTQGSVFKLKSDVSSDFT